MDSPSQDLVKATGGHDLKSGVKQLHGSEVHPDMDGAVCGWKLGFPEYKLLESEAIHGRWGPLPYLCPCGFLEATCCSLSDAGDWTRSLTCPGLIQEGYSVVLTFRDGFSGVQEVPLQRVQR